MTLGVSCGVSLASTQDEIDLFFDQIDPPFVPIPCDHEAAFVDTPTDPCEGAFVLSNEVYLRTAGSPNEFSTPFMTDQPGVVCVRVMNGTDNIRDRISAGWVNIDADPKNDPILGPSDFNKDVLELQRERELDPAVHELRVRLASQPGSFITVDVRFAPAMSEQDEQAMELVADLRQLTCEQRNEQLSLLGAEEAARRREQALILGRGAGQLVVRNNAYGVPRRLDPLPLVDVGQTPDDAPEVVALKWLEEFRPLLRWDDPSIDLVLDYVKPSVHGGRSRVRFRETMAELPVDAGFLELVTNVGPGGALQVTRLVGNFVPEPPESFVPTLDAQEARERAALLVGGDDTVVTGTPTLVVYDRGLDERIPLAVLAWRVSVLSTEPAFTGRLWIDADTGEEIDRDVGFDEVNSQIYESLPRPVDDVDFDIDDSGTWLPLLAIKDDAQGIDACFVEPDPIEWCVNVVNTIEQLDAEWRGNFDRLGWSGDGLSAIDADGDGVVDDGTAIPADDDYRVALDQKAFFDGFELVPGGPPGVWINQPGLEPLGDPGVNVCVPLSGGPGPFLTECYLFPVRSPLPRPDSRYVIVNTETAFTGPRIEPDGTAFSPDAIRHEFGHGFHQVEVGHRGETTAPDSHRIIGEQVGDFWAMVNPIDSSPFVIETQEGRALRDNELLEGVSPTQCREYVHYNFFGEPGITDVHVNACVLNRVAVRALDVTGPRTAHGVTSLGVGLEAAKFIFYQLFTEHTTLTDTVFDWVDNYRQAVATLIQKCETDPGAAACPEDRDPADAMDALWGTGFYSEPIDLAGVNSSLQTTTLPAAVVTAGRVYLFFSRDGALHVAVFDDPIDESPPIGPINLTTMLPDTAGATSFAVASPNSSTIHLAYVDGGGGANLHVAELAIATGGGIAAAAEDSTPGLRDRRAVNDRPAIIHNAEGNWFLAFVEHLTFNLLILSEGQSAPQSINGVPADGVSPTLFPAPSGAILLYRTLTKEVVGRRVFMGEFISVGPERSVRQLQDALGSTLALDRLPVFSAVPPSGAVFPSASPRLQVFTVAPSGFVVTEGISTQQVELPILFMPSNPLEQVSLGTPPIGAIAQLYPDDTESRNVRVVDGGRTGAAAVAFEHPIHGEILLVYHLGAGAAGQGTHIMVSYKKSD